MRKTSVSIWLCLVTLFFGVNLKVEAQTWTFTGNMNVKRSGATATLLNNGDVLVVGGLAAAGPSAELYNPSTGTFSPTTGSVNTGRVGDAAALLPNGEVLIVGGEIGYPATCLSSAELYNPSTGTFTYTGSLTTPMCGPTATTLLGGKVLVADGTNAELYDPSTGAFTVTGSFQVPRSGPSATLLGNGKVLFVGGNAASGPIICPGYLPDCNTLTSAELYDPSTGTFTLTGSMQASRYDHTATLMSNGQVLIAGGAYIYPLPNPPGPPLIETSERNEAEVYNPATGTFAVTGSMNHYRAYHVAAPLPIGKVLVAGGSNDTTAELYDPSSGTFTYTAPLADERDEGAQAVVLDSGFAMVLGGVRVYQIYRPEYWNTAEIFNATTPNFTLTATPASQTVNYGSSASYTVTVSAPTNGFTGNVTLTATVYAPPNTTATATFSTNPITGGSGTSTLTVTPGSIVFPNTYTYNILITGTSGNVAQSAEVTLLVNANGAPAPDFSLSATPASQTVAPGNGTSYTVTATPSNGFSGNVNLSLGALPAGVNATLSTNPIAGGSGSSTLSVTTTSSATPGTYTIPITGTSGSLTHSATVTLVVNAASTPDFSLSATPASQTVVHGNGTSYTLTLTPSGGFAGNVSLSLGALPAGVHATFNTNPIANGSGTSTLTVTTTSSTTLGTYTLKITGTSGSLTHSTSVTLIVRSRRSGG